MTIKAGDKIPAATLKVMTPDGPANVSTAELFGSGKVVMFSVPGAFTPTCSARHVPGFVDHAAAIMAKGVDRIVCTQWALTPTWLPKVPLHVIVFAGLGLAAVIERTLPRIRVRSSLLAVYFAIMAGAAVMYGIFEGNIIRDNVYALVNNQFESIEQIVIVGVMTLFVGGFFWMAIVLGNLGANTLYLVTLLLGFGFFLILGIGKARDTIRCHQRLKATHPER